MRSPIQFTVEELAVFPDFDEFRDHTLENVVKIADDFEQPDADFEPTFLAMSKTHAAVIGLGPFFVSRTGKDTGAAMMTGLGKRLKAEYAAYICSAWVVDHPDPAMGMFDHDLAQHPERKERVVVQFATKAGWEMHWAEIERHDDEPPTLGEWTVHTSNDYHGDAELNGRFGTAVREAVK